MNAVSLAQLRQSFSEDGVRLSEQTFLGTAKETNIIIITVPILLTAVVVSVLPVVFTTLLSLAVHYVRTQALSGKLEMTVDSALYVNHPWLPGVHRHTPSSRHALCTAK